MQIPFTQSPIPQPRLSLVGAGPGDPELITLKGVRALEAADAVLYDALAAPELLEYVPKYAPQVYVGKRAGQHSKSQSQINELLVEHAFLYGHVVRLKGGDPLIFGRAQEEISYAQGFGIPVSVVPGISSATSLTALQQVPLTQRGLSQGFWVLTATTEAQELNQDLQLATQSSATLVILMGVRKLLEITQMLQDLGKESLPVAIIQNGSRPDEKSVLGRVSDIYRRAQDQKVSSPAIIVIGEVLQNHPLWPLYLNQVETRIPLNKLMNPHKLAI